MIDGDGDQLRSAPQGGTPARGEQQQRGRIRSAGYGEHQDGGVD
jgi:hypothetical protein